MIKPLGENVLLKLIPNIEKSKKGIILGENLENKSQIAEIIAIGEECEKIRYGQHIIFNKYSGTKIEFEDIEYLIVKFEDILAVID